MLLCASLLLWVWHFSDACHLTLCHMDWKWARQQGETFKILVIFLLFLSIIPQQLSAAPPPPAAATWEQRGLQKPFSKPINAFCNVHLKTKLREWCLLLGDSFCTWTWMLHQNTMIHVFFFFSKLTQCPSLEKYSHKKRKGKNTCLSKRVS